MSNEAVRPNQGTRESAARVRLATVRMVYSAVFLAAAWAGWGVMVFAAGVGSSDPRRGLTIWSLVAFAPFFAVIVGGLSCFAVARRWLVWRWVPPLALAADALTWLALNERPKAANAVPDRASVAIEMVAAAVTLLATFASATDRQRARRTS